MVAVGRLAIGFEDQRYNAQSFWADNVTIVPSLLAGGAAATMIGKAVTFAAAASTIKLAADGDAIIGKLLKVESDGACTVQNKGNTTLPAGNGATVTPGRRAVGALGPAGALGYIRDVAAATAAEQGRIAPAIWDVSDLANVVVDLGG